MSFGQFLGKLLGLTFLSSTESIKKSTNKTNKKYTKNQRVHPKRKKCPFPLHIKHATNKHKKFRDRPSPKSNKKFRKVHVDPEIERAYNTIEHIHMAAQRSHIPVIDQVVTSSCYHPSNDPCHPCTCCILSRERAFIPSRGIYSGPIDGWPEVDHGSDSDSTISTQSVSDDPDSTVHLRRV